MISDQENLLAIPSIFVSLSTDLEISSCPTEHSCNGTKPHFILYLLKLLRLLDQNLSLPIQINLNEKGTFGVIRNNSCPGINVFRVFLFST